MDQLTHPAQDLLATAVALRLLRADALSAGRGAREGAGPRGAGRGGGPRGRAAGRGPQEERRPFELELHIQSEWHAGRRMELLYERQRAQHHEVEFLSRYRGNYNYGRDEGPVHWVPPEEFRDFGGEEDYEGAVFDAHRHHKRHEITYRYTERDPVARESDLEKTQRMQEYWWLRQQDAIEVEQAEIEALREEISGLAADRRSAMAREAELLSILEAKEAQLHAGPQWREPEERLRYIDGTQQYEVPDSRQQTFWQPGQVPDDRQQTYKRPQQVRRRSRPRHKGHDDGCGHCLFCGTCTCFTNTGAFRRPQSSPALRGRPETARPAMACQAAAPAAKGMGCGFGTRVRPRPQVRAAAAGSPVGCGCGMGTRVRMPRHWAALAENPAPGATEQQPLQARPAQHAPQVRMAQSTPAREVAAIYEQEAQVASKEPAPPAVVAQPPPAPTPQKPAEKEPSPPPSPAPKKEEPSTPPLAAPRAASPPPPQFRQGEAAPPLEPVVAVPVQAQPAP
ncbi:unnamed protein product [Symbiodinium natans]|uniref:Uncharacterized protein n=1 Tax=Symbiodinium natans TaxID=878477 RepID=A0A812JGR8_9DINO|nr:unnamed protein product [Symbiodinium natans]